MNPYGSYDSGDPWWLWVLGMLLFAVMVAGHVVGWIPTLGDVIHWLAGVLH